VSVPDTGPWARRVRTIRKLNRKLWGRLTSKGWTVVINWKCELPGSAQSNTGKLTLPHFLIILLKEISRLKLLLLK
jgi:G:T-mismatch repair DNA endonuclease (very short patch repair protein)